MFQHFVLYRDKWVGKNKEEERIAKLGKIQQSLADMGTSRTDGRLMGTGPEDKINTMGENSRNIDDDLDEE